MSGVAKCNASYTNIFIYIIIQLIQGTRTMYQYQFYLNLNHYAI